MANVNPHTHTVPTGSLARSDTMATKTSSQRDNNFSFMYYALVGGMNADEACMTAETRTERWLINCR